MDIIAHPGAIRRRIIIAKHRQTRQSADRHLADEGQQIVGNAVRVFANQPRLVGTHRVEVAQQHHGPTRICLGDIAQHLLDHQLGATIGVGRRERKLLADGYGMWVTVDGGRRAEDQIEDAGLGHLFTQGQGRGYVVLIVGERNATGFPHRLQTGKVDDRFNLVLGQHGGQGRAIPHIQLIKRGRAPGDGGNALQHDRVRVAEVIHHHHILACLQQRHHGMTTDIPGTTRDQYRHIQTPVSHGPAGPYSIFIYFQSIRTREDDRRRLSSPAHASASPSASVAWLRLAVRRRADSAPVATPSAARWSRPLPGLPGENRGLSPRCGACTE